MKMDLWSLKSNVNYMTQSKANFLRLTNDS